MFCNKGGKTSRVMTESKNVKHCGNGLFSKVVEEEEQWLFAVGWT